MIGFDLHVVIALWCLIGALIGVGLVYALGLSDDEENKRP